VTPAGGADRLRVAEGRPATAPPAATRTLGRTTVSLVSAGQIHWQPAFPLTDVLRGETVELDARGRALLGQNWLAVRTGNEIVLVDPTDWRTGDTFGSLEIGAAQALDAGLRGLEIAPGDVTHVVVTHGHIDHLLGLIDADGAPRFPSATYHFPAADWSDPELNSGLVRSRLEPLESAGQLVLTRGDTDVCPHVRVLAAPGETDGHQVVEITDAAGTAYYLGDLVHFAFEFSEPGWLTAVVKEPAAVAASRRRICERAITSGADVVFTHAPTASWARLHRQSHGWRYEPTASTVVPAR
jgi:glyoxylase-like metal-dependent hydrolase (beta-lactamase superfamily II)